MGVAGCQGQSGCTTRGSMTSATLKGGRCLVPSLLTSPPIWRAVFAQCQAMGLLSSPFLTRGVTVFQMVHFSRRLDVGGGIEKASGREPNYYEKRSSEWSEETSFRKRILSFEEDGRLCCQMQTQQGRLLMRRADVCRSAAGV